MERRGAPPVCLDAGYRKVFHLLFTSQALTSRPERRIIFRARVGGFYEALSPAPQDCYSSRINPTATTHVCACGGQWARRLDGRPTLRLCAQAWRWNWPAALLSRQTDGFRQRRPRSDLLRGELGECEKPLSGAALQD